MIKLNIMKSMKDIRKASMASFTKKAIQNLKESISDEMGRPIFDDNIDYALNKEVMYEHACCSHAIEYYDNIIKTYSHDERVFQNIDDIDRCFIEANKNYNMFEGQEKIKIYDIVNIKTIAYCITVIVCALILAFAYLQSNRYIPDGRGGIMDRQEGIVINKGHPNYKWREDSFKKR